MAFLLATLAGCQAPPEAGEEVTPRPPPKPSMPPPEDPNPPQLVGPAAVLLEAPEDAVRLIFEATGLPARLYLNATFANGGTGDLVILDAANQTVWQASGTDHRLTHRVAEEQLVLRAWARGDQDMLLRSAGLRLVAAEPLAAARVAQSFTTTPLGGEADLPLAAADVAVELTGAATARARLESPSGEAIATWPGSPYGVVAGLDKLRLVFEVGSVGDVTVQRLRLP